MTPLRFSTLCVVAVAVTGCSKDATFSEPLPALAAVSWMNALPDTGQVDIRIVDIVSNAGFFDVNFRTAMTFPQAIEAGQRHIRVFMSSTDPTISQKVLLDTTFTFAESARYFFYLSGFTRAGQSPAARGVITTVTTPTVAAGKFAVRILNLAPTFAGAIPALPDTTVHPDVFLRKFPGLPSGAPEVANLAFSQLSAYVVLDTGRYILTLTGTGTTTPGIVNVPLPLGVAGTATADPIAGSLVPGSILTAVILPRAVLGSAAPQGGRPTARATQLLTRSNDTVTVQTGSTTILTNRGTGKADSTLATSGTGDLVNPGDAISVSGATQPEYNGWPFVMALADSLFCKPTDPADTKTKCAAASDTATTFFRYRFRIVGTPVTPATGTVQYRIYPPGYTASDFTLPYVAYLVDRRP